MRLIAALALLTLPAAAHAAEPITGQWLTKEGKAIVAIAPCGKGVCGHIAKVLKPNPGGRGVDERNPNPALRNRPIVGLPILTNFTDAGRDWRGRIYDPEGGKEYRSILKRLPDGSLQVQGCIAFFCQTQTWKPAR
ncbi:MULTISPECIES: DUF2147 domain-containing protein [Sphingomonas]|uniref:DUF2147 domain-containing protein n=1 Tax=Sphingomonas TaxID=13687 RepID=UPI00082D3B5B|nr:DUF2147 domain-containing protein [Sphingomonas sp. CCH10-B3]